jgi:cobalt-precorrin-5B (C1)-methyltransferase
MMAAEIMALAAEHGAAGDVEITVSIAGGEALAAKTWNPRLGIVGGLSVLGTTGVVIPYSCSSWIHSIQRGIDVARATGRDHVAGATGATSEAAIKRMYGLDDTALLDMGDFAGGMLKYLRRNPVPWVTIAGGFGKLSKLARGHLDLHSSRSQVDFDALAETLADLGATPEVVAGVRGANTAAQALDLAGALPLAETVARRAREVALATLAGDVRLDVAVFDRKGDLLAHAGP